MFDAILPGGPAHLPFVAGVLLVLVNLLAGFGIWLDRRRELAGEPGVPDRALLRLAYFGGWPGAKLMQLLLRARAGDKAFRGKLNRVLLWQGLLAGLVIGAPMMAARVQPMLEGEMFSMASLGLGGEAESKSSADTVKMRQIEPQAAAEKGSARWIKVGD